LASQGHEVIWWTSNFSHHFKKFRSDGEESVEISSGFNIKLIPTTGYKKNIGVGRIIRDLVFSYRTYRSGKKEAAPDLILYSESPLCFGYAGPALARYHDCALVYDQMDLWPELMVEVIPDFWKMVANLILFPVYVSRKKVFERLDGLVALAEPYLTAALNVEPGLRKKPTEIIYNGIDVGDFREKMKAPFAIGVPGENEKNVTKAIFAGSLGPSYDIRCILDLAERVDDAQLNFRIFIAGDGPMRQEVEAAADQYSCLTYFGKLAPTDLCSLYSKCDIGLTAYSAASNVEMPDKFYDYTAAGLAIACSLKGEVMSQILDYEIGLGYEAGNSDSLLRCISMLSDDSEALRRLKNRSFEAAIEFGCVAQNEKLLPFFEKVISQKLATEG
jgi:glycosyltransferase involved in cell wall biosynthesis